MFTTNKMIICFILLLIYVILTVLAITLPYCYDPTTQYAVIGVQTFNQPQTVIGCLGSCPVVNNNCVADDATQDCQVIQAFFILAIVFGFIALFGMLIPETSGIIRHTMETVTPFYQYTFAMMILSLICMFIAVILSVTLPVNQGVSINDKASSGVVKYSEGFGCAISAIILGLLVLVSCGTKM